MKYWEIIADNLSKAGWSWGLCRGYRSRRANDLPGMARSKERRADVLDQVRQRHKAHVLRRKHDRQVGLARTRDSCDERPSGDGKTISRPVSETESKLAQIRNANQWASERKSH